MDNKTLTKVALRYRGIFIDVRRDRLLTDVQPTVPVMAFVARLRENGYCVSEELLHALGSPLAADGGAQGVSADRLADITAVVSEALGTDLNWAPLVKGWQQPTHETRADHLVTWIANLLGEEAALHGTTLPCGHLIPEGTFPLERYNGCPFCGKPFRTAGYVYRGQGSKLKELRLMTPDDMTALLASLLTSPTPPDATQRDSIELLLGQLPLPSDAVITMKETAILAARALVKAGRADEAARLFATPTDILRYLWYEKTGQVQLLEPRTLVAHARRLYAHMWQPLSQSDDAAEAMRRRLRLSYDRKTCRCVAQWLNALPMTAAQGAEDMNAKRPMWVRMIRALRLGEYARREGFGRLKALLDVFYRKDYTTFQSRVDKATAANDADGVFRLLGQRPGLFARCLFATMLRYGSDKVTAAFSKVADDLPPRLLLSLANAADTWFDPTAVRLARPLTGTTVQIAPHRLLSLYTATDLKAMADSVKQLFLAAMSRRFAARNTDSHTVYIDPSLFNIPMAVGDRACTVQDTSCALQGTRFPVEGDAVRLFLQWGKGLHAQHLDMDLSCRISLPGNEVAECAYYSLNCPGAKHSGDIRSIPELVGTAEYIELSMPELEASGATYVTFTCNAYSTGALSPNLMVGWMDSRNEMRVSEEDGVAYDPSCVQHIVRISESNLSKGLVFGVLDVRRREIVWLEMPFTAQTLRGADSTSVEALLRRLSEKVSVGQLLHLRAEAQGLTVVDRADEADETFTAQWALNAAQVSKLLD